jgi:hypothetical protein
MAGPAELFPNSTRIATEDESAPPDSILRDLDGDKDHATDEERR